MSETLTNLIECEHNGASSAAAVLHTPEGPRYILRLLIHPTLLEQMVGNYEFALDNIKLLSYYFATRHAGDALETIREIK